jgi:hypothetical protein
MMDVIHGTKKATVFWQAHRAAVMRLVRERQLRRKGCRKLDLTEMAVRALVRQAAVDCRREARSTESLDQSGARRDEEAGCESKTVRMERDLLRRAAAFFCRSGT